jgi:hypothetical protein
MEEGEGEGERGRLLGEKKIGRRRGIVREKKKCQKNGREREREKEREREWKGELKKRD